MSLLVGAEQCAMFFPTSMVTTTIDDEQL